MCIGCALLQFVFVIANIVMICALSVCKLSCLLNPMRARTQTNRAGYILVGILWLITLIYPLQLLILGRDLPYDPKVYRCMAGSRLGTIWEYLELINVGIFITIPLLTILVTSIWLLAFVHKVHGLSNQSLVVVLSVSFVFTLSTCPVMLYNVAYLFTNPSVVYFKLGAFLMFISSVSNPFLYLLTSKSFKDFITKKLRRKLSVPFKSSATSNDLNMRRMS